MSETLSRTADPYRPIFEDIERTQVGSTSEAYLAYTEFVERKDYDPSIYLSMAITSGGYARDEHLTFPEVLAQNAEHGALVADVVAQQYSDLGIKKSDIIVPATLGKVNGWGQADYLLFWAHVITGLEPDLAQKIDDRVRMSNTMSSPGFTDKSLSKEVRWLDYKSLINEYVNSLDDLPAPLHPRNIQAVILILDAEESLGVNAERYLCHRLGIGEYVFGVDRSLGVTEYLEAVRRIGASTLSEGTPHISGNHNIEIALKRRAKGQYWRKSGILSGIVDRREAIETQAQSSVPVQTSAELWEEYFANK